jgi:hypothetical protein
MAPAAASTALFPDTSTDDAGLTAAWSTIHRALDTHILSPSSCSSSSADPDPAHLATRLKAAVPPEALARLAAVGLAGLVLEYVVEGLDAELRKEVAPRFWAHFGEGGGVSRVCACVFGVCVWFGVEWMY